MPHWCIGTSGFSFPDWRGVFYPPELPRRRWLEHYAREFPSVELNVTFFRTPGETSCRSWAEATPPGFRFVLKAPRLVSHVRRLVGCAAELGRFWQSAAPLWGKVTAVLLQTPPSLRFDPPLLEGFLATLPSGFPPVAWEVRHGSFLAEAARTWFEDHRQALVTVESARSR